MSRTAAGLAELSDVLHGRRESFSTESEILQAISQDRRRALVLSRAKTAEKPRPSIAARNRRVRLGGSMQEQLVIDIARMVGRYETSLGSWPSIFDAMLDLSGRVILGQPWDDAMGIAYEESFLLDPAKPMRAQALLREWSIRKSILGNPHVASAIAATTNGVSAVVNAYFGNLRSPFSASAPAAVVAKVTRLSKDEVDKADYAPPPTSEVQLISDSAISLGSSRRGQGAMELWRSLSKEWCKTPNRPFTSAEAAGVFDGSKAIDGGKRRCREHLRGIAVNGQPILIRTKPDGEPLAYYLVSVLEIGP